MRMRILGAFVVILGFALSLCLGQPGRAEAETEQAVIQEDQYAVNLEQAIRIAGGIMAIPRPVLMETTVVGAVYDEGSDNAAGADAQEAAEEMGQPAMSQERAVQIAKEMLAVPEEMEQFSSSFYQDENESSWSLNWWYSNMPNISGSMNVTVDANNGEILNMSNWQWPRETDGKEYQRLPKYTREQAEAMATAFAKKLQPERFKESILQTEDLDYMSQFYSRISGSPDYSFYYVRYIDGVIYPNNGIRVSIDGSTGEVRDYYLTWDREEAGAIPPPDALLSPEQAEQLFRESTVPELCYFYPNLPYGIEADVRLVYMACPESMGQFFIDALTGEFLRNQLGYNHYYMYGFNSFSETVLNLAEDKKPENLITQDDALKIAQSAVIIPADYVFSDGWLNKYYPFNNIKVWAFSWYDASHGSINVSVHAGSGEIMEINHYEYNKYDNFEASQVKFSDEEARRLADDYIKKNQPDKWEQVAFVSLQPIFTESLDAQSEQKPFSYTISYVRIVNGIKFPQNGFYMEVDSSTGEICSYRMIWDEVRFPAPDGLISMEEATEKYLQEAAPLTLSYQQPWLGSEKGEMHLAYYLPNLYFAMLDAVTGQTLDPVGNIIFAAGGKEPFTDLSGHPAQAAVELLVEAGIIAERDDRFRPDEPITQGELIAMLARVFDRSLWTTNGDQEAWNQLYYKLAAFYELLPAGVKTEPDSTVSREVLAGFTVQIMKLSNVAKFNDIYLLDFPDSDDISPQLRGCVALSIAFGLLQPTDGGYFQPQAAVTRAEAAEMIVKLLQSEK